VNKHIFSEQRKSIGKSYLDLSTLLLAQFDTLVNFVIVIDIIIFLYA